jgi:hypothetical protein
MKNIILFFGGKGNIFTFAEILNQLNSRPGEFGLDSSNSNEDQYREVVKIEMPLLLS